MFCLIGVFFPAELACIQYGPYDYAETQKARPYGRCLLTVLTKRGLGNGPQGHSLTHTTTHHKGTAITHTQPVDCTLGPLAFVTRFLSF